MSAQQYPVSGTQPFAVGRVPQLLDDEGPTSGRLEQLLTAKDVAKLLDISVSSIFKAVAAGSLPAIRLRLTGSKKPPLRFSPHAIRAWIAANATSKVAAT